MQDSQERPPHVMLRYQRSDDGERATIYPELRGQAQEPRDITVKVVCRDCNNGWMSSLETAARPVLRDLEAGERHTLELSSVEVLALWAAKTAAMYQYNDWPSKVITPDQLREMFKQRRPPDGVRVWMGRMASTPDWQLRMVHTGSQIASTASVALGRPRIVGRLGHTLLALSTVFFLVITEVGELATAGPAQLSQLWPVAGTVDWPSPLVAEREVSAMTYPRL